MIRKYLKEIEEKQMHKAAIDAQIKKNKGKQIQFYNFWEQPYETMFWYRFLTVRPELLNKNPKLKFAFFSVFGNREIINDVNADVKIFYSAENLKVDNYLVYSDHFLSSNKINLSMGYEYFDHERYVRFPNWMDVFFLKKEDIKKTCNQLRYPNIANKNCFAACVASHGGKGLRDSIVDSLNDIDTVSCSGKFRHNDDSLVTQFNDNKIEYLKSFYFNICPENSNAMGYVTEKLFQSISVGCIPIYWGSYNKPELEVLNQDAIIFWNPKADNSSSIKLIKELYNSPKLMQEYIKQPRLIEGAEDYILSIIDSIEKKIMKIF